MSRDSFLGIDLGASGGRAVLGTLEGERLAVREIHRFGNAPVLQNGTLYWDVLLLWRNVLESLRVCARDGHAALAGIGADTWGVDFGLVGRDGRLLGNPVCYRDGQAQRMEPTIRERMDDDAFYAETGMAICRVGSLPQLLALKERCPGILDAAEALLMMPDLFRFFLSGERSTELTILGSSLLASIHERGYSRKVFGTFGLPERLMPHVAAVPSVAGPLLREVREQTGLASAPVLVVAGHDTLCASCTAPHTGPSELFISSGTWSVVGVAREEPVLTPESRRKGFVNELGASGLIFVRNVMGFHVVEMLRRQWQAEGKTSHWAALEGLAASARPFSAMFDLEDASLFAPENPEASLREYLRDTGQSAAVSTGELVRGYLEGLALLYRRVIDDLQSVTGEQIRRICLVGGGCRNALYCQLVSDSAARQVLAGPAEAASVGNIGLQALAVGSLASIADIRGIVRRSFPPDSYEPRDRQLWDDAYGRYRDLPGRRHR